MAKQEKNTVLAIPNGPVGADDGWKALMADIPDFTPAQWAELQAQTRELEIGYVPTRSLIPGL